MERVAFIPFDEWKPTSPGCCCPMCRKELLMLTQEELEQIATAIVDNIDFADVLTLGTQRTIEIEEKAVD